MKNKSRVVALLLSLLLLSGLAIGISTAGAITEGQIETISGALELVEKLEAMQDEQELALDALDITIGIIQNDSVSNQILTSEQRNSLFAIGLTKSDVLSVLSTVEEQLADPDTYNGLVSGDQQLVNLIEFYNTLKSEVDPSILQKLSDKGITEIDLIETAIDLANLTYDPYESIPRDELEQIFNENFSVDQEIASKYGLNYTNVENLRAYLVEENKIETFKQIMDLLGLIPDDDDTGNGGPGGGPSGGDDSDTGDLDENTNEAENTVNDPNASDDQVAESTNNTADSLDDAADNAETAEEAEQVVNATEKVVEVLNTAVARVQDPQAAGQLGDAANKVVSSLAKTVTKVTTAESKQKIVQNAVNAMNTTQAAITKMEATKAAQVASEMIKSAGTLVKALQGQEAKQVAEKIVQVAEKAVERAGTDQISSSEVLVENQKASVTVDPQRLAQKAQQALQAARELADGLKDNGITGNKKLDAKVTIEVPATGAEQVETTLPAGTLDALAGSGINAVEVKTEVATIAVQPGSFGNDAAGKDVSLSAAKVEPESIPAAVRNQVPSNSVVVDLNANVGDNQVSNFAKPIKVSIPYTPAPEENLNQITVFLLRDDGTLQPMGGKYDPVTGMVKFKTSHFSKYFAKNARKTFGDLGNYAWAKDSIEILAGKGIIAGKSDNTYDPGANVTRAEFSALVVRLLGLSTSEMELPFNDVPEDAWYQSAVATAYANNIVGGKSTDTFDPNGKITRQEMAAIIARILTADGYILGNEADLYDFADQGEIAEWARSGAALATREGIIAGMSDGSFAPQEKANRAQTGVMLYRLYEKLL